MYFHPTEGQGKPPLIHLSQEPSGQSLSKVDGSPTLVNLATERGKVSNDTSPRQIFISDQLTGSEAILFQFGVLPLPTVNTTAKPQRGAVERG